MTLPVVVAAEAERQANAIDRWWRAHRSAAPDLFRSEFVSALELIDRWWRAQQVLDGFDSGVGPLRARKILCHKSLRRHAAQRKRRPAIRPRRIE